MTIGKTDQVLLNADPLKMEFEMLRQPLHFMKDRNQAPSWLLKANEEIVHADGFLVVSSEYNCR